MPNYAFHGQLVDALLSPAPCLPFLIGAASCGILLRRQISGRWIVLLRIRDTVGCHTFSTAGNTVAPSRSARLIDIQVIACEWMSILTEIFAVLLAASFQKHVLRVVTCGTQEKMPWIATRRIVAMVTNEQPFRNWPVVNFPGQSMCKAALAINAEYAIAASIQASRPFPAPLWVACKKPGDPSMELRKQWFLRHRLNIQQSAPNWEGEICPTT